MGKALGKIIAAVVVVFIGTEMIKKKYPGVPRIAANKASKMLKITANKIKEIGIAAKQGFKEGYSSVKSKTVSSAQS